MNALRWRTGVTTLRGRILLAGTVATLLIAVALGAFVVATRQLHDELGAAATSLLQEQRIADNINAAVLRQLALASTFPGVRDRSGREEFRAAGERVHAMSRAYLFRDLTPEQRLLLEAIRTEHQRLEVAAIRAAEQYRRGVDTEGEASLDEVIEHAGVFADAVNAFLRMREQDVEHLQERQSYAFRTLTVGALLVGLLLLLSCLAFVRTFRRRVAEPLADLAGASTRMADGDLSTRVDPGPDRELRTLGTAFNRMAATLERTTGDLERQNDELEGALETLQATQRELIQAERLGALGRMTAGFAHEINGPLASVLGYGQLLDAHFRDLEADGAGSAGAGDVEAPSEVRQELLEPLLSETERARRLVRSLLATARRPDVELLPVWPEEAISAVARLQTDAIERSGARLVVDVPDVPVSADPQLLQSVLQNLLSNALDAMADEPGDTVTIRGERADDVIEIRFEDEGHGFSDPERAFEPFFTTKPVDKGTGLGLAMVHQFVTAFGGTIHAENRTEGGARVILRLRVAEEAARAGDGARSGAEAASDGARSGAEAASDGASAESAGDAPGVTDDAAVAAVEARPPERGGGKPGPRILVVEDEPALRKLQQRILRSADAEVLVAKSASEARETLRREKVDLVISDVRMPGESGVELYEWVLREQPDLAERFLFVTGYAGIEELEEHLAARPDRLLRKPFEVGEYLARVRAVLG